MPSLRLWILAIAVVSFAAGTAMGIAIGRPGDSKGTEETFDRAYADQLVADYSLSAAQARSLQIVLQAERAEEKAIRLGIAWADLPEPLQRQWRAAQARTGKRIRTLLDPEQQVAYDRASQPVGVRPDDAGREAGKK